MAEGEAEGEAEGLLEGEALGLLPSTGEDKGLLEGEVEGLFIGDDDRLAGGDEEDRSVGLLCDAEGALEGQLIPPPCEPNRK